MRARAHATRTRAEERHVRLRLLPVLPAGARRRWRRPARRAPQRRCEPAQHGPKPRHRQHGAKRRYLAWCGSSWCCYAARGAEIGCICQWDACQRSWRSCPTEQTGPARHSRESSQTVAYTSPGPERTRMGRRSTQLIGGHAQLRMAVSPSSLRGRRRQCGRRRRAAGRYVLPACPRRAGIPGRRSLRERPRWRVHTDAGNVLRSPANQSIHAPAYLLKGLHEWLVKNCLEFLKPKLSSYWLN